MRISDWSSDVCSADLTPMSGILGLLDLLDTTSLDNRQRHYISLMQSASGTLQTVLNDVLDFAKIEAGELTMEMSHFDLEQLIERAVTTFSASASTQGVDLLLDLQMQQARGDEGRVGKEGVSRCRDEW